jgi:hypothetical protein
MSRRIALVMVVVTLTGCERVVDLQVTEGPKRLVVEARLERVLGRVRGDQAITLRTTAPYFTSAAPPPARGAVVRVSDDAGRETIFTESSPGTYTTSQLVVNAGTRYTLSILYEGQRYQAADTAHTVAAIDSLYFEKPKPGRFSGTGGMRATIDLRDPPGERNFYLWEQYVDGVRQLGPDTSFKYRVVANDDAFDGIAITGFQPYEGVNVPAASQVLIRQIALSEAIYRFYFAFSDQVSADGSPFSVPPASVRGNVANLTDPTRFPLGYFYASEVAEARATRRP